MTHIVADIVNGLEASDYSSEENAVQEVENVPLNETEDFSILLGLDGETYGGENEEQIFFTE